MLIRTLVVFSSLLFVVISHQAYGCKDRIYPLHLRQQDLDQYSDIYIARILEVVPIGTGTVVEQQFQRPPHFMAKLQILKTLKGKHKEDDVFEANTSNSEAHAVCPIELKKNRIYLLFLQKNKGRLEIPTYGSLYKQVFNLKDDTYIVDAETHLRAK